MKNKKYTIQDLNNLEALWRERVRVVCESLDKYCSKLQDEEMNVKNYVALEDGRNSPVVYLLDKIRLEIQKYKTLSPGEKIIQELEKISEISVENLGE